jgi:hypothetical protein
VSQTKRRRSVNAEEQLKRENERPRRELAERGAAAGAGGQGDRQREERDRRSRTSTGAAQSELHNHLETTRVGRTGRSTAPGRPSAQEPPEAGRATGHPGHSRPLVPAERVHAIVDPVPDACPHCQATCTRATTWATHVTPSSHRIAAYRSAHHRVSLSPPSVSRVREDDAVDATRRDGGSVRSAAHRVDCVSDGRVPVAPFGRATAPRRGSGISTRPTRTSGTWRWRSSCTIRISSRSCTRERGPHEQRGRARSSNCGAMENNHVRPAERTG